jgi:2-polyprenyl-3-methyl-5-hydroxy-6-metoxy-1,4-benzoquinol methylase
MSDTEMSPEKIHACLDSVRNRYGAWTAHNIELPHGITTLGERNDELIDRIDYIADIVETTMGSQLSGASVLDLGCLEGGFAIRFAEYGASVVHGIDVREQNIAKADCARTILGLQNVSFFRADVMDLDGCNFLLPEYDIVLCAGLLYHLDYPQLRVFLESVRRRCSAIVVFDTHHAEDPSQRICNIDGTVLFGSSVRERNKGDLETRRNALWSSWSNDESFWLSQNSFCNLLMACGFRMASQVRVPFYPWEWKDRVTWVVYVDSPRLPDRRCRRIPLVEPDNRVMCHPASVIGHNRIVGS